MKKLKTILLLLIALLILTVPIISQAKTTSLTDTTCSLVVGESTTLKIGSVKANKIKWKSSKTSVATVSNKGVVKAKKAGSATITATYNKIAFKCKVTVVAKAKNVTLCSKNDFKIVFTGIEKNGIKLKITNKTNNDYKFSIEYLVCDGEYYDDFCDDQIIPNSMTRTVTFKADDSQLETATKKIKVRVGVWDADTGYIYKYVTINETSIRQ